MTELSQRSVLDKAPGQECLRVLCTYKEVGGQFQLPVDRSAQEKSQ